MATKVGLANFKWLYLIGRSPNPSFVKILGLILNASWVIVIFVWKFPNFRYHGNRGWSDRNFCHTVKSADLENPPIWRKNLDDISYTSWVTTDFVIKSTKVFTMAMRVGSAKIWTTPFDRPKPPVWCKIVGPILNVSWVIVICVW